MTANEDKVPILSVIVPVCNVERFLDECMDSIKNQAVKDIQVICINDGSTDSSLEILKRHAIDDYRIEIIDKANAGYGAAMNDGLDRAIGTYLAILESDDFTTMDGWSKLLVLCQQYDLDLVKGCYWRHSNEDELFKVYEQTDVHCPKWIAEIPTNVVFNPRDALRVFWMTPSIWSCVYKRSFLIENEIRFNETAGASFQDTGFFFQVWATAKRAMIVDDPILHYRIDNEGSSSKSDKKVHAVREEMNFIRDFLKNHKVDTVFSQVFCSIRFKTYIWNINRIADKYIPEFKKAMVEDLFSDFSNGYFSPLLFNKKDASNFLLDISEFNPDISKSDIYSSSPLTSVIVLPSDSGCDITSCIQSIQMQDYENIEVICMINENDCDAALSINSLSEIDSRFKKFVYTKLDSTAFRDAMFLLHGSCCLFVLPDAYYSKSAIRRLCGSAYTNNLDIVFYPLEKHKKNTVNIPYITNVVYTNNKARDVARTVLCDLSYQVAFSKRLSHEQVIQEYLLWRCGVSEPTLKIQGEGFEDLQRVVIAQSKPTFGNSLAEVAPSDKSNKAEESRKHKRNSLLKRICNWLSLKSGN